MSIYSREDYILLSKINSEKIILENKKMPLINLFIESIKYRKNIFQLKNKEWLIKNCKDKNVLELILKYNNEELKKEIEIELEKCKKNNIKILTYESKRYPSNLKCIRRS